MRQLNNKKMFKLTRKENLNIKARSAEGAGRIHLFGTPETWWDSVLLGAG